MSNNPALDPPKSWEWYGEAIKWFIAIATGLLAFGFEHASADKMPVWREWLFIAAAAALGASILAGLLAYLQLLGAANLIEIASPTPKQTKALARRKKWLGSAYVLNVGLLAVGVVCFTLVWLFAVWIHESPPAAASPNTTLYVQGRPGVPMELLWFRDSAERQALYSEIYAEAWRRVQAKISPNAAAPSASSGAWGVVMDIDETILDNSEYQARLAITGRPFEKPTWEAWVSEHRAPAFPPAKALMKRVHDATGKVILVTNRLDSECADTRRNLESEGLSFDALLCAKKEPAEKETRFAEIQNGSALPQLGAVKVLLFIGDDIRDCQGQSQGKFDVTAYDDRCLALPDPMYGSWTSNPYK
jgi:5'-nucleotidase (lipoprotein e(P4) family)